MNVDEILNRHSLKFESTLKKSDFKEVLLLKGNYHKPYILKRYLKYKNNNSQITERNFLLSVRGKTFDFLIFPEVIDYGNNFLLTNYVPRIEFAKKSMAKSKLSANIIKLIVSALREFQSIKMPKQSFSLRSKFFDSLLPAFKLAYFVNKIKKEITISQIEINKLIVSYFFRYPLFNKTLSHTDLQISNFSFHYDYKKMSMIDFERLHVFGDPFLDVLNYLITASYKIENWTFQSDILKEYINSILAIKNFNKGLADRIKLILLFYCCSYFLSVKNIAIKNAYLENIKFLSCDDAYNKWIDYFLS